MDLGTSRLDAARRIALELGALSEPRQRGEVFKAIAKLYGEGDDQGPDTKIMMLEAAIQQDPLNQELRFDVAYAYGQAGAEELALLHYRKLLDADEHHTSAANNAGAAAEAIGLPVTAVQFFKKAEAGGSSLATANLSARLITAGFIKEAVERLDNAKQVHGQDVHRNVMMNLGRAADAEHEEETKVTAADKRARRVARWKRKFAEALVRNTTSVAGTFSGKDVTLVLDDEGVVTGTLDKLFTEAVINGSAVGGLIRFSWKTKPSEAGYDASNTTLGALAGLYRSDKRGFGRAIILSPSQIEGYFAEGDYSTDSTKQEGWTEFMLERAK